MLKPISLTRLLLPAILMLSSLTTRAQSSPAGSGTWQDAVREAYDGERAKATVAYVEQFWRLVGNAGFDSSIYHVADILENAGFVREEHAPAGERLTFRIERRPLQQPAWEPVTARLSLAGEAESLLRFESNRNMVAINSFPTPAEGVEAEVIHLESLEPAMLDSLDLAGKIVFADMHVSRLYRMAVQQHGALGVLAYYLPGYNQAASHPHSITFQSIPYDPEQESWGICLSYAARNRLKAALARGPQRVRVQIGTRFRKAEELTLVAELAGSELPEERFVFSAHVQEPGANDNASGVGALAEMARVSATLLQQGRIDPKRSITFLWGDEIISTRRYVTEDSLRRQGIRWGLSLDMVGEDTEKTGGSFLIEKMPDPSAIWTRGDDKHTEWGGRPLSKQDLFPHYFNDFALQRCREQAAYSGWEVNVNPFEGGSDHVPFLRAGIPGLLFWHFTDVYYHTDGDRIDKVSGRTLENVGVSALLMAYTLTTADAATVARMAEELENAALQRLQTEAMLSAEALAAGGDPEEERDILQTWTDWYVEAIGSLEEVETGGSSPTTLQRIEAATGRVEAEGRRLLQELN